MTSMANTRQPLSGPAQGGPSRRSWLWAIAFALFLGVAWAAAPHAQPALAQTVPPPNAKPTVLVGPILAISDGEWVVAGVSVAVGPATRIDERVGPSEVGAWARVIGAGDDAGGLTADRIKILPVLPFIKLMGPLDALDDTSVVVDGILLGRTASTRILGAPVPRQDYVQVFAALDADDRLLALHVNKLGWGNGDDDPAAPGKTQLVGEVQSRPADGAVGRWVVSGIQVDVTNATHVDRRVGPLLPGAWVKVHGRVVNGVLVADKLMAFPTHPFHSLKGVVTALSASQITIDGLAVNLAADAKLEDVAVGCRAVVRAVLAPDGTLLATEVSCNGESQEPPKSGASVRFSGTIEVKPAGGTGEWTIAGRKVTVSSTTVIDESKGPAVVGALVDVKSVAGAGGALLALSIRVQESNGHDAGERVTFVGPVETLPSALGAARSRPDPRWYGEWTVSGRTVVVSSTTQIQLRGKEIAVGTLVKVEGLLGEDGSVQASLIDTKTH